MKIEIVDFGKNYTFWGAKGDTGLSAYQIALQNGFVGTLQEWITSLKGEKGDTGLSAYELAVQDGFEGTFEQWIESLVDIYDIGIFNASTGIATTETGQISLTEIPPVSWKTGQSLTVTTTGAISFSGINFISGTVLNLNDKLRVIGNSFALEQKKQITTDDLLQYSGAINTLGRYLITADLVNGATSNTDSIGNKSLLIPSGSSGNGSVLYIMNTLLNSVQVAEVGTCTKVFFNIVYEHSATSSISSILRFKGRYYINAAASDSDLSFSIIDPKHTRVYGWINVPNNFTAITSYIQFKQVATFNNDFSIKCISASYFTDTQIGQTAVERNRILNPDQSLNQDLYCTIVQDSYFGEVFNGATLNSNRVTIPVGQTGQTSYAQAYITTSKITNFSNVVGKAITFKIVIKTSTDLTNVRTLSGNAHVIRNGNPVYSVATNRSVVKVSANVVLLTFTYTPNQNDTNFRPFVQISDATIASTIQYFELADIYYFVAGVPDGTPNKNTYAFTEEIKAIKASVLASNQDLYNTITKDSSFGEGLTGGVYLNGRVTIPIGQTGVNSYAQVFISNSKITNFSNLIGKQINFYLILNTSNNITDNRALSISASVERNGSTVFGVANNRSITKISSSIAVASFSYIPQDGDTVFKPFIQTKDTTVASSVEYFELSDIFYFVADIPAGIPNKTTYTFTQEIKGIKDSIDNLSQAISSPNVTVLTVKRDGTGMFASPKLANDSIIDSSPLKWYLIDFDGVYTEIEWTIKPFTIVRGRGIRNSWLKGELPDNATDAQITNSSTIWLKKTSYLENCKVTAKNMRYAVHSEEGGANRDQVHNVFMCYTEHYGNQGAKDWRNANPLSGMLANTVWNSDRPWGYGAASGLIENYTDCTFVANKKEAYYVHNNKDFTKPNRNFLKNCTLSRLVTFGQVVVVESLGSGQSDSVEITDCSISKGFIKHNDNPWITEDTSKQYANHAEYRVIVSNSSKIGYLDGTRGRALKIESNSILAGSKISVSGTAVPFIFGDVTTKNGGVGLKGYQYGYWDISGILVGLSSNISVVNTLGKRLGDCSSVNKTLTVLIDGTTTVNIVFNTDLTAVSNATILNTINTALGSNAIASEYNPAEAEYYPHFPDKEQLLTNTGTLGIPRFSAVTYNADSLSIKLATSTDTVIGFTLEPINVGEYGRVLFSGILSKAQLGISNVVNFGSTYVVDPANAGKLIAGNSNIVAKAIATDWVEF